MKLRAVLVLPLLFGSGAVAWAAQSAPVGNVYAEAEQSQEPQSAPQSGDEQQTPAMGNPSTDTDSEGSGSSSPQDSGSSSGGEE